MADTGDRIRRVQTDDAAAIASIYNGYVSGSNITFEEEPVTVEEMASRIARISAGFPYLVWEEDGAVKGYCHAHAWKERSAYRYTAETTVYLSPDITGRGVGTALMRHLIAECREMGLKVLIACITEGNAASNALHERLGFRQVSRFEKVGLKFGRWLNVADYELILDK